MQVEVSTATPELTQEQQAFVEKQTLSAAAKPPLEARAETQWTTVVNY